MVNWSLDTTQAEISRAPPRRRRSSLKVKRRGAIADTVSNRTPEGRVPKVINGQVVYLRVRRVKA